MVAATSTEAPLRAAHRGGLGALPAGPAQARWSRRQVETIARSFCAGAAIAARTRLALAQKKAWTQHSCHQTQSSSQTSRIACPQCLPWRADQSATGWSYAWKTRRRAVWCSIAEGQQPVPVELSCADAQQPLGIAQRPAEQDILSSDWGGPARLSRRPIPHRSLCVW